MPQLLSLPLLVTLLVHILLLNACPPFFRSPRPHHPITTIITAQTPIARGGGRGDDLLVVGSAAVFIQLLLIFLSLTVMVVTGRTEAFAMTSRLLIAIPLPQSAQLFSRSLRCTDCMLEQLPRLRFRVLVRHGCDCGCSDIVVRGSIKW